ncbi:hypothetical protein JCM8547_003641 [Rhodosporidiobolus lusitaniae]
MSFSDLTRSVTTFPPASSTSLLPSSSSSSSQSLSSIPASYSPTPVIASTSARVVSSYVPPLASEVAASESAASSGTGGGGVDEGLALGLGIGLGLAVLLGVLAALFVVRSRRNQRKAFDQRAQQIRATMDNVKGERETRQVQ